MFKTPFAVIFDSIIAGLLRLCKCAFLVSFLLLQIYHGGRYFPQTGFRNVTACHTKSIDRLTGIKIRDVLKILKVKVVVRVDSAPGQQHICHAILQGGTVGDFYI